MYTDHKKRWILSPVKATGEPLAADYCMTWEGFLLHEGKELVFCIMNAHQHAAAKADPRLVVMGSLHSSEPVHGAIAAHYAGHGVQAHHTVHDALRALAVHHPNLEPEV